jgi:hypothetical protein
MIVHADDDVQRFLVFDRRRDDHLLDAGVEVGSERLGCAELARALQDDVDIVPRDLPGLGDI